MDKIVEYDQKKKKCTFAYTYQNWTWKYLEKLLRIKKNVGSV